MSNWNLLVETKALGTLFFDNGFVYLADRNASRVGVFTINDIVRDGHINLTV